MAACPSDSVCLCSANTCLCADSLYGCICNVTSSYVDSGSNGVSSLDWTQGVAVACPSVFSLQLSNATLFAGITVQASDCSGVNVSVTASQTLVWQFTSCRIPSSSAFRQSDHFGSKRQPPQAKDAFYPSTQTWTPPKQTDDRGMPSADEDDDTAATVNIALTASVCGDECGFDDTELFKFYGTVTLDEPTAATWQVRSFAYPVVYTAAQMQTEQGRL
jgi:hypothetical protein